MSQNGIIVQTAKEFAEIATKLVTSTKIYFIPDEKIKKKIAKEKPYDDIILIPGISKFHEIL